MNIVNHIINIKSDNFLKLLKLSVFCIFSISFQSCSTKTNNSFTRNYTALTTKYNVYFNANEAYKEELDLFEKNFNDDFTNMIFLHPVSSLIKKENIEPNAGFDRAIEKCQKAIKLKSISRRPVRNNRKYKDPDYKEFLKRDEYNPFIHNAWLLMGKSYFYKGDFVNCISTFLYISRHFKWKNETVA